MAKQMWILLCGMVTGLTSLSIAMGAVPSESRMRVTDDTAIYQRLSEIKAPRQGRLNFDGDIQRLANMESRYREKLPSLANDPRLAGPMKRIASQKYRPSKRSAPSMTRN